MNGAQKIAHIDMTKKRMDTQKNHTVTTKYTLHSEILRLNSVLAPMKISTDNRALGFSFVITQISTSDIS
jgi:hypothetical protein